MKLNIRGAMKHMLGKMRGPQRAEEGKKRTHGYHHKDTRHFMDKMKYEQEHYRSVG